LSRTFLREVFDPLLLPQLIPKAPAGQMFGVADWLTR
jgi:hypothetical protein